MSIKIKVELDKGATLTEAEELMEKALKVKSECDHGERYSDDALNEAHDLICSRFQNLLNSILLEVEEVIKASRTTNFK